MARVAHVAPHMATRLGSLSMRTLFIVALVIFKVIGVLCAHPIRSVREGVPLARLEKDFTHVSHVIFPDTLTEG